MVDPDPWRVLVVDDDEDAARQVREILEAASIAGDLPPIEATSTTGFDEGLRELERSRVDLVVLDVRLGEDADADEDAGVRALQSIKERRFVPVVFNTAIPNAVRDLASAPLVDVVEKAAGPRALTDAVRRAIDSGLPSLNRALVRLVEDIVRQYMWGFVATHWQDLGGSSDRGSLARLLVRRLAASLATAGVEQLEVAVGAPARARSPNAEHPMRMYLMPPLDDVLVGDIVMGSVGDRDGYWVVLSPSCDLAQGKADVVLLAAADLLEEADEVRAYRAELPSPGQRANKGLRAVLKNSRVSGQAERYYFLPGALSMPDLLVDLQRLRTVERPAFDRLVRVASLDSPYAEAVVTRFLRYYGRLGTPDVDTEPTVERVRGLGSPAVPEAGR